MEGILTCSVDVQDQPMDCHISPTAPLVASAQVSGVLRLFRYQLSDTLTCEEVASVTVIASGSCRGVCFSPDGASLYAGTSDSALHSIDCETSTTTAIDKEAHKVGINRVRAFEANSVCTGDDSGNVKVWDTRSKGVMYQYKKHTDFITDIAFHHTNPSLVVTSGDGTLSVHDVRKRQFVTRSEDDADDELLSAVVVKGGRKVVVGTQSGVLSLYSWGALRDCSDRYPGHPESVDAVVKYDEDTVLTGSSDGVIRIVSILPNKLLGVVGEHTDFPVERLALSGDRRVLASASHDNTVQLWDISLLQDEGEEEEEEEEEEEQEAEGALAWEGGSCADVCTSIGDGNTRPSEEDGAAGEKENEQVSVAAGDIEVTEDQDSDAGNDNDSDSDEGGQRTKKKRKRGDKTKWSRAEAAGKNTAGGNFFSDLL